MVLIVFATWYRMVMVLLIMDSYSVLLMTIMKMMGSVIYFFALLIYYLLMMGLIALAVFGDFSAEYKDLQQSIRTMFDCMMGSHGWGNVPISDVGFDWVHTFFWFIHIYISNIFLLNYMVAILATVYSQMQEIGIFSWNVNRY